MERRIQKLALIQMSMTNEKEENLQRAIGHVRTSAKKGATIIALPELFATPYFCINARDVNAFDLAEEIPGPTSTALGAIAKECRIVLIGGSIFEKKNGKHFNTSCVYGPDGTILGIYRKAHIPHDPGFYEQDYFVSGDEAIEVHETPLGKIAVGICYDQWFPEFARIAALKGAELIVYPTAIGSNHTIPPVDPLQPEDWPQMWRAVQVGHAAANCVYVAGVNRVGDEDTSHFFGHSFITDPNARLLVQSKDYEEILITEIDLSYPKRMQNSWRFLLERRPDLYGDITKLPKDL